MRKGMSGFLPIVQAPLLIDLLLRGCEDHHCRVEATLLGLYPPADLVSLLDFRSADGACQEPCQPQFYP